MLHRVEQVLVAYGGVWEIAESIGVALQQRGMAVDVRDTAAVDDVMAYDAVVLGGAVARGRWNKGAVRFAKRFAGDLIMVPVWLFSSGPLDDSAERHVVPPVPSAAKSMARLDARAHMTFGGLSPEVRRRFRRTRPESDFRNFDRVTAWAEDIGIELATPALHLLAV